ncbi:MAG: AAA family ATPase [Candidatus Bathyarchaeia archaeon]
MHQGSVFKDKERLLPNFPIEKYWRMLPHRERELKVLWDSYGDALERRGEAFLRIVQVLGPAGSGQTCTMRLFGSLFEEEARRRHLNLSHIYVNLKLEAGRKVVLYRSLLGKVDPGLVSASLSAEEMLRLLVRYLQDTGRRLLLTIDEIDYYVRRFGEEGIVYDLTRLNELTLPEPCGVLGATFLARDRKFHELLDLAELSTLGRSFLEFRPYTSGQIADILERRAKEALKPGSYSSEVLEFIADVTASPPVNGDLRYALDLLLYSGRLAEEEGSDRILPEHVRRVHGETFPTITTEDIQGLPDAERITLLALARTLRYRRAPYASLKEIRRAVGVLCEELKRKPLEDVEEYLQDLHDRGIIEVKGLTRIGISGVPVEDLDSFLRNLIGRVEGALIGPSSPEKG